MRATKFKLLLGLGSGAVSILLASCVPLAAPTELAKSDGNTAAPKGDDRAGAPPETQPEKAPPGLPAGQRLVASIKSAPLSISPMSVADKGTSLRIESSVVDANNAPVDGQAPAVRARIQWTCVFRKDVNGNPVNVSKPCGSGPSANIDLRAAVEASHRRTSELLEVEVKGALDGQEFASIRRQVFLDARLSKTKSCFANTDSTDVEASRLLAAQTYAAFANYQLNSATPIPETLLRREGPVVKVDFGSGRQAPGLATIRDIVRVGNYLVMMRNYRRSSETASCRNRGVRLGRENFATALVFDASGRYVAINDDGAGNLSVARQELNASVGASAVIAAINRSMPIHTGQYGDLGATEIATWINNHRSAHMIVGLNEANVRSLLGR